MNISGRFRRLRYKIPPMSTPKRGSFNQIRDLDAAKDYDSERFETSARMRKLNRWELEFARMAFRLAGGESAEILDMPCGNGRFFESFKAAQRLYLLDYAPTMLEALVEKHPEAAALEPKQGDIMNIPLDDQSVDLAFSMRLFHHLEKPEDRQRALSELARVSRRFVALSFYNTRTWRFQKRHLRGKPASGYAVSISTFAREAAEFGLRLHTKFPAVSLIEQQRCLIFEKAARPECAPEQG